ncbi:MAG TPA: AAA family ATPase [Polyangiaceae bacterium]|nr:AAA family ATPase [Polyangiaceae bacterium]
MSVAAPLLGRARELELLDELLTRAEQGRGGIALLLGEAGIGKSSLAEAFESIAEARDVQVVRGRALEFTSAPPYFPLWPCLRSLGIDPSEGFPDAFRLWERVAEGLAQRSAQRPLLWLLEDLHATDEQTLELLNFMSQPVRGLRVMFLLSARPRDARLSERAARLLTRIGRDGTALTLAALSTEQVKTLTERTAGLSISEAAAARLLQRTRGNPLFVLECARVLQRRGAGSNELPSTVRDVIDEQLSWLPPATRAALSAAAVLGSEFSAARLAELLQVLPARAIDDLLPAVRAGLLLELEPGAFAFHHALAQEAVYRGTSAATRSELHTRAERAFSQSAGEDPRQLFERADHALAAAVPTNLEHALALAERAIALAEAAGTHDRAFHLAQRAHDLGSTHLAAPAVEPLLRLARLAHAAGLPAELARFCELAARAARQAGDAVGLARAALQLGVDVKPAVVSQSLIQALSEARSALGAGHAELSCRLQARLAAALQPADDPAVPMAMAREALALAAQSNDERLQVEVLLYAGSALADFAPLAERLSCAKRLLEKSLAVEDWPRALTAYARLALDSLENGELVEFDRMVLEHAALSRELGHPRSSWRSLLLGSMQALARGDFALSERLTVELEQLAGLVDEQPLEMSLAVHRWHAMIASYHAGAAAAELSGMSGVLSEVPFASTIMRMAQAFNAAWFGDRVAARRALDALDLAQEVTRDTILPRWAAEAIALVGTAEEARVVLSLMPPDPGPELVGGHVMMSYDGPACRVRGLLLAVAGDLAQAEVLLSQALERVREHGFRPWIARLGLELARVQRLRGLDGPAQAALAESLSLADVLGIGALRALLPGNESSPRLAVSSAPPRPSLSLAREGEGWSIALGSSRVHLRDSRGLELLARLVERPGEELHVLSLASDEGTALNESNSGDTIDPQAARAYRARLAEIARVMSRNPVRNKQALLRESELLQQQLAQAFGLHGARKSGSLSERARVNVQRRLRDAVRRVGELDADLGRYLERAVRTGTYCSFRP